MVFVCELTGTIPSQESIGLVTEAAFDSSGSEYTPTVESR